MATDDALPRRAFLRVATAGAVTAAATGTATAQEGTATATPAGNGTATGTANGTATGTTTTDTGGGTTRTVDMTDALVFDPEGITVEAGDTVVWENVGSVGHSVTAYADEIPEAADYWASGGFDSEEDARANYPDRGDIPGGESYRHTFETLGTHGYFCIPHEGVGMVGTVEVVEEISTPEPIGPAVPDTAKTLGVGAAFAMVATLVLTYLFLQFGGESPGDEAEG